MSRNKYSFNPETNSLFYVELELTCGLMPTTEPFAQPESAVTSTCLDDCQAQTPSEAHGMIGIAPRCLYNPRLLRASQRRNLSVTAPSMAGLALQTRLRMNSGYEIPALGYGVSF